VNSARRLGSILLVALGVALFAPAADAKTKIASRWLDREITIDGEIDEWRDALTYVKSVDAYVAMFNDAETMYLCLYSQSPQIAAKFAEDGIRARFEGGEDGAFVVRSPAGGGNSLDLQVPGQRDGISVAASGEAGIEAGVSHRGSFVFELKIPLQVGEGHRWAPGFDPGDQFKLVVVNPQIDKVAEERALQENRFGGNSPMDPSLNGRNDPGWTGSRRQDEAHFIDQFVFLLKARVKLANGP
jgi:hypothetical protein